MRVRFYKVTITDSHLTRCVIMPARSLKSAKLAVEKNDARMVNIEFVCWYWVDIFVGSEGLHFLAHINGSRIPITNKSWGFDFLHESLGHVRK